MSATMRTRVVAFLRKHWRWLLGLGAAALAFVRWRTPRMLPPPPLPPRRPPVPLTSRPHVVSQAKAHDQVANAEMQAASREARARVANEQPTTADVADLKADLGAFKRGDK